LASLNYLLKCNYPRITTNPKIFNPHFYQTIMELELKVRDITTLKVDAIVNAANSSLIGGVGVDGAIHRAAGPKLKEACLEVRRKFFPKGLPQGEAVITPGFNLPARYIIHTVGPIYDEGVNQREILEMAYTNSLRLAEENGLSSIAFPAISTGIFGYPKRLAAEVVYRVMKDFKFNNLDKVILAYLSE
jgi:O-acetyl-ADP-ribose deacetylase